MSILELLSYVASAWIMSLGTLILKKAKAKGNPSPPTQPTITRIHVPDACPLPRCPGFRQFYGSSGWPTAVVPVIKALRTWASAKLTPEMRLTAKQACIPPPGVE